MSAWATASKTNFGQINKLRNQSQRLTTGAMTSTPTRKMEEITDLQEDRKDTKILIQAAKFKRLRNHPMNDRLTKCRLKRGSFVHRSRRLEREIPFVMEHEGRLIPTNTTHPSWKRQLLPSIVTSWSS